MTTFRRHMLEDLQLRGLAPRTQPCDSEAVTQLTQHDRRAPDQSSEDELRQYFLFLINEKQVAESTFRIHLYGMRFFYERTLQRPWPVFDLVRPRHPQKLPVVLSPREVRHLLALVMNPTARMCLQLIDACGLRLREGTQLQVSDLDSQRMLVRVRQGSGTPEWHSQRGFHPYAMEAFRQGLRDLGYIEGQNLVIEHRSAEGSPERLPHLAAELVQLPVEVLVVQGAAAIRATQQVTSTIPIVMVTVSDAVEQGFAASLARPRSNITGLAGLSPGLSRKRLEFLEETVPHLSRVAVLVNPANRAAGPDLDNLIVASRVLGLYLHILELRSPDELDHAFPAMTHEGAEALLVIPDSLLIDGLRSRIVALAATHRLPAIYPWKMYVEAGGLISYAQSLPALWQRAVYYVDRILKGAKTADLPIEQPTTFELVINLKTAQSLGITFPPALLMLADGVIQ